MYTDGRSKKVAFVAHCLLNQNSISDGTAVYPAAFKDVIHTLLDADIGIVQLPCPELCCLGLDRGNPDGANVPVVEENTRIRRAMKEAAAANKLTALVDHTMLQIHEYSSNGFEIVGIIGANRSPNCGVETTSDDNREIAGMGLFMQALADRLKERDLVIPMIGLKSSDDSVGKVMSLLE